MIGAVVTGVVRRGGGRRLLRARRARIASRRASSCGSAIVAGLVAEPARRVPDRRPPGQARREAPAGRRWRRWRAASRAGRMAGITIIGQPNVAERRLDNPIRCPALLSFLAFGSFHSNVPGLDAFPEDEWPDNIELLYYAFHVMVGPRHALHPDHGAGGRRSPGAAGWTSSRGMLWVLMLAFPFPYIANTAGWMTAELGRQPWIVYGLMRTGTARARRCTRARRSSRCRLRRPLLGARHAVPVSDRA